MPSDILEYLHLGVNLANQYTDLNAMFAQWPRDRTAVLRVCRPHPEVENYFKNWLTLYVESRLKDGAVVEEPFSLYLDTSGEKYAIKLQPSALPAPTVQIFLSEMLFWDVAARTYTIYTAFITGKPIIIRSSEKRDLGDLAHMDKILSLIHDTLLRRGINLATVVR